MDIYYIFIYYLYLSRTKTRRFLLELGSNKSIRCFKFNFIILWRATLKWGQLSPRTLKSTVQLTRDTRQTSQCTDKMLSGPSPSSNPLTSSSLPREEPVETNIYNAKIKKSRSLKVMYIILIFQCQYFPECFMIIHILLQVRIQCFNTFFYLLFRPRR